MGTWYQRRLRAAAPLGGCLILLACQDPSKPPAAPDPRAGASSEPPSAASASPPASAAPPATTSSAAAPAALLPLPKPPPGVDPDQFEVLASICAVASWKSASGAQVGCRSTPPFDGPTEKPDGVIREETDFSKVCFLETFLRGSFSAPGKDQALLGLEPCGDDRANDITPGNIVLVEKGDAGWRVLAVEKDTNLRGCVPAKGFTPTLLVCNDNVGAFSEGSIWWRFTLDFSQSEGKRSHVFSKLYKTPGTTCGMGVDFFVEREVTLWTSSKEHLGDATGDGIDDLTFTIERSYTPGSPALARKFEAQCKKKKPDGDMTIDLSEFAGPTKSVKLDFQGRGRTLVPTPATAKQLEEWGKKAPDFWWNMIK